MSWSGIHGRRFMGIVLEYLDTAEVEARALHESMGLI